LRPSASIGARLESKGIANEEDRTLQEGINHAPDDNDGQCSHQRPNQRREPIPLQESESKQADCKRRQVIAQGNGQKQDYSEDQANKANDLLKWGAGQKTQPRL
jgi:hypothetical protein